MATRYAYGSYLRTAAEKGKRAMAKATTTRSAKSERVVKPMKSTRGRRSTGRSRASKLSAHPTGRSSRRRGWTKAARSAARSRRAGRSKSARPSGSPPERRDETEPLTYRPSPFPRVLSVSWWAGRAFSGGRRGRPAACPTCRADRRAGGRPHASSEPRMLRAVARVLARLSEACLSTIVRLDAEAVGRRGRGRERDQSDGERGSFSWLVLFTSASAVGPRRISAEPR